MEFLAKPGPGRTLAELKKGDEIFAQGDEATAVFYVQKGRIRISVISKDRQRSHRRFTWRRQLSG